MARTNTNAEVISEVSEVGIVDDVAATPGDTTLSTGPAKGDLTIDVVSATNFSPGDLFRIGDRPFLEGGEIETINTLEFTLKSVLSRAYASGEAVVEIADVPIGDLDESGIRIIHEGGDTPIRAGTQKGVYTYVPSGTEALSIEFALLNNSMENWAESIGRDPATAITGAGTTVDPYVLDVKESEFAQQPVRIWYFLGVRLDSTIVRVDAFSAKIFSPTGTMTFTQGEATVLPFMIRILNGYRFSNFS